jgi:hypothetical protein
MKPKKKHIPAKWAREAAEGLTNEQVLYWCRRLGIIVPPDTRTPMERLVDEACSKKGRR